MNFNISISYFKGNERNCCYPNTIEIDNPTDMREAVSYDHVCAVFRKGKRNIDNFISSNVIVMDCDNDHSNDAKEWITAELIDAYFPDVNYVLVPSRNNNKQKGEFSARPRFHVYFQIDEITDAKQYASVKRAIAEQYPFFDENALDAARFIFGNDADIIWHEGECSVTSYLELQRNDSISEGKRNSTMSHFAGKIIKRYGDSDKAYQIFMEKAAKCDPPLDDIELDTIWKSAQRFGKRIAKQEGYVPPEQYGDDFDEESDETYKPIDFTDVGQATVLAEKFSGSLRYSPSTDYLVYNGSFWEESKPKAQAVVQKLTALQLCEVEKQIKQILNEMCDMGMVEILASVSPKKAETVFDDDQLKIYKKFVAANDYKSFVLKRRNSNFITSALKEARPMLEINPRDLDANEFLLNTPNFTIDLTSGDEIEHEADNYITKQTTVDPSNEGDEVWQAALDTFFCGDKELIDYVQQIVGLAAIGKVYVEALIIAFGEGKNGKSTFWNTIARVLGSYSGHMSAETLTTSKGRNVKPEMAELKGKRLVIASETEDGQRLSTASIKQLCSTDDIYAEKKYKDPFSYVPSHTLVLYTNHLPKVGEIDKGTWRRLIVIPFDAKITTNQDIKNYADYLYEVSGGAILKWVIDGARNIIDAEYKLTPPGRVQAAIDNYMEQNNWLKHFIDECCEVDALNEEKSGELYQEYRNYCIRSGEYIHSPASFYSALESSGFTRRRTRECNLIVGLSLKSDFLD